MTRTKSTEPDLQAEAERAVEEFEQVPLGAAYAEPLKSALGAIGRLFTTAMAIICPRFAAGAIAEAIVLFEFCMITWPRAEFAERAAALHGDCLACDVDLAAFLRSGPVVDRVADAGAAHGAVVGKPAHEVAAEFTYRFAQLVAAQLVGNPEFEPHASILQSGVAELHAQVDACHARHVEHALAEVQRRDRETKVAEEALGKDEHVRRHKVITFLESNGGKVFLFRGEAMSGQRLGQAARRYAVNGNDGLPLTPPVQLAELEAVMRRALAAEGMPA